MNNTVIAAGMVVKSMAGHDSGSYYAVMRVENGFAYIADGKLRKVERPKKKNPLHLQKTLTTVDLAEITNILHKYLLYFNSITNKKLRSALSVLNRSADNIAEESDKLV